MELLKTEVQNISKYENINCFAPQQNYIFQNGKWHLNLLFHTYKNADKAIKYFEKHEKIKLLSGRIKNETNAYFKYFITLQEL